VRALGPCRNRGLYRLAAGGLTRDACGVHLAQIIKNMLALGAPVTVRR
jgi:hypothetical protein